MTLTTTYYEQIVTITKDFLGPASERFVNRQISFHLEKEAGALTKDDVEKLAKWMQDSLSVITKDKQVGEKVSKRIIEIIK